MTKPLYAWDNHKHDYNGPDSDDEYVIIKDGKIMEPGDVVNALNKYEDMQEQVYRATARTR